jgi:hypothetical protein
VPVAPTRLEERAIVPDSAPNSLGAPRCHTKPNDGHEDNARKDEKRDEGGWNGGEECADEVHQCLPEKLGPV